MSEAKESKAHQLKIKSLNDGQAECLELCPPHRGLSEGGSLLPFVGCIACLRNHRDALRKVLAEIYELAGPQFEQDQHISFSPEGLERFNHCLRMVPMLLTSASIANVEGLQEKEPADAPVCAYRIGLTTCGYTLANHHKADGSAMDHLFQPAEMVVSATDEHPAIYKSGSKLVAGAQFHQMSTAQIEVARHALGLPNKMKTSYRNRFCAGIGHSDYENWVQMVADGHAEKSDKVPFGGDSLFWLTRAGALQAIKKGEKLDPEDFTPKNQGRVKNRLDDGPALPREK